MKTLSRQLLTAVLLFSIAFTFAQDGAVDLTFNPDDSGYFSGTDSRITTVLIQPDGKIILAGKFKTYHGVPANGLVRINPDETIDTSFNADIRYTDSNKKIGLQPDGKILVSGSNIAVINEDRQDYNNLIRLNHDGSKDENYVPFLTSSSEQVLGIAIQSDGKAIIFGEFLNEQGVRIHHVFRRNLDGSSDNSFNMGTAENGDISSVVVQPDGKIVLIGDFSTFNGHAANKLVRLNADGSYDSGITENVFLRQLKQVKLQPDGKIVVLERAYGLHRFNVDLSVDSSFLNNNTDAGEIECFELNEEGKIVISVNKLNYVSLIKRLNSDGNYDNTFSESSTPQGEFLVIKLAENNKLYVGGWYRVVNSSLENNFMRINSDGTKDIAFYSGATKITGAESHVTHMARQNDGKIMIAGSFLAYDGVYRNGIARINQDGRLDESFNPGSGIIGTVRHLKVDANGNVIIAGDLISYNGIPVSGMIRIKNNGVIDESFSFRNWILHNSGSTRYITAVEVQPDGRILVGGPFNSYANIPVKHLIRLNNDGSLDDSFDPVFLQRFEKDVVSVKFLPDSNKILVFNYDYVGEVRNVVARLNLDGSTDDGFTQITNELVRTVFSSDVSTDGKIIIYGLGNGSNIYNGILVRFNANGTLDRTLYLSRPYFFPTIDKILHQPDGKILLAGNFRNDPYNTLVSNPDVTFIRLNTDGAIDTGFSQGNTLSAAIRDVILDQNRIVVAGEFTLYNNVGRNSVARLNNNSGALDTDVFNPAKDKIIAYKKAESVNILSSSGVLASVQVYDITGRLVAEETNVNLTQVSVSVPGSRNSILLIKAITADGTVSTKKIF